MQPKSPTTPGSSANPLRKISCDLQEERNLGVETSTVGKRTIEEMEGEGGNGIAIALVCGFALLIMALGAIAGIILVFHLISKL